MTPTVQGETPVYRQDGQEQVLTIVVATIHPSPDVFGVAATYTCTSKKQ